MGEFKVGLSHGHEVVPWGDEESLAALQRQLDVDILITGRTHENRVHEYEGRWFINPGSITGAYSPTARCAAPVAARVPALRHAAACALPPHSSSTPSFILMAITGPKVVTYVYELNGDKVDVSKSEFSKS